MAESLFARRMLAKSEVFMHLAVTAQRWSDDVGDRSGTGVKPFAEWPDDDPLVTICRTYSLAPADLSKIIGDVAQELENRSVRAGYAKHWDPSP